MCSVGDGFNIDLSEDEFCEYKCNECGNTFKGVNTGKTLKCPECHSADTKIVWKYDIFIFS